MEKFDVIIVGAGLAGLGCAYTLAGKGLDVLVLERGDYPGSKNASGGRLYINPIRNLFPELWDKAPLERHIVHESITMMARERSLAMDYTGDELRREPHQSYSLLRSKFDRWLAEQVETNGTMLMCKVKVNGVLKENNQIVGVIAGGDELLADVVIACDGVLSFVAEKAGLRTSRTAHDYAVGIKEVITLEPTLINERFHLEGNEGAARLYVGDITSGKFGGGFIYTNKESISLGIVIGIEDMGTDHSAAEAPALFDAFKQRREIADLIKGGTTVEYAAHLIAEGGYNAIGNLYGNGILLAGDAAGLALNIGFTVRGMEYALASGYYAAQTVLKAKESGDYSSKSLSLYKTLLEESFVLKDFLSFRESPAVVSNPRFFNYYPEMIGNILQDIYNVPTGTKEKLYATMRKHLSVRDMWGFLKDLRRITRI
jgi:electron transfer flavoprotein-quinone oxidoreductase